MVGSELRGVAVLVTGGAGFIGSHLVDALLERGARVCVLDNFLTGKRENLRSAGGRVELIEGDIRDRKSCADACRGVSLVFHEAALGSVPRSIEDPATTIDINVAGTAALFTAARDAAVHRVVYASSSSVYGDSTALPKREGEEGRPLSPYALSKVMNEQLADIYARCFGIEFVGLRYFNVFGPRQDPNGPYAAVVPRFFAAVKAGEQPVIYGDGEQSRDFTYVKDVVDANFHAAGAPPEACGRAYNVAPGKRTTILDLARHIIALHRAALVPQFLAPRPGDVAHSQADSSQARLALGFTARWTLKDGLKAMAGEADKR
jgi:nucleoside-diphosphate-sugar epimerase